MMERPLWQRIAYNIWPFIRRVVNDTLFLIEKIIRGAINTIKEQIYDR
jgi:hypothetical protein